MSDSFEDMLRARRKRFRTPDESPDYWRGYKHGAYCGAVAFVLGFLCAWFFL